MLDAALRPDHAWIAAHIPHQGRMCLLDRVLAWDAQRILCAATSHRGPDNPLRDDRGRLGASHAIEYAAQAMAVHGVLLAGSGQPLGVGYLASVRGVRLHVARIDDLPGELEGEATLLANGADSQQYAFRIHHADTLLAEGRASVMLGQAS